MNKRQALPMWQDIKFLAVADGRLEELLQSIDILEQHWQSGQIAPGQLTAEISTYATSLFFLKTLHNEWRVFLDLTLRQASTLKSLAYRLKALEEKIQHIICLEGLENVFWQTVSLGQRVCQNKQGQVCHFAHRPSKKSVIGTEALACVNF